MRHFPFSLPQQFSRAGSTQLNGEWHEHETSFQHKTPGLSEMSSRPINTISNMHGPFRKSDELCFYFCFRALLSLTHSRISSPSHLSRSLLECCVCNEKKFSVDLNFSPKNKRSEYNRRGQVIVCVSHPSRVMHERISRIH